MAKIYCPECAWKPRPNDLWTCFPGCGHDWHTFDTRAQCPNCCKQWRKTQCLACDALSPHESWYHDEPGERAKWDALVADASRDESAEKSEPEPTRG